MNPAPQLESTSSNVNLDLAPFVLRTSDRILFKRCRRLWGWLSHHKQALQLREHADYLWFGTGMHFALEDYHGLNLYSHPSRAFQAYVMASTRAAILPGTWMEHRVLGALMMDYYADQWLSWRDPLQTYEINQIPQVEVNGAIDLGVTTLSGRPVYYGFTLDRVAIDEDGQLWIVEYKSAKRIQEFHLDVDDQITSYCWAAWRLYNKPVAGVVYQQHRKSIPQFPKVLQTGKVSTDKRQSTSAAMYAKLLEQMYGSVQTSPPENRNCYAHYVAQETEDKDLYVVRHRVYRNEPQLLAFEQKILMELEDIANENLPLYPNPQWTCDSFCPLQAACVAMDDGSDWQYILSVYGAPAEGVGGLTAREKDQERWRKYLPEPHEVERIQEDKQYAEALSHLSTELEEEPSTEQKFAEELGL